MRSVTGISTAPPPGAAGGVAADAVAARLPGEMRVPTFAVVLGERAGAPAPWAAAAPSSGGVGPLRTALMGVADAQRGVDRLIDAAARGRTFTPAQLLALQVAVSRDAQAVEVVSRVTDRLVGAVKQALGAQI